MLNRPLNSVMARLAIVAAALALLMLVAPAVFAATSVDYAEDRRDAVASFSATDQDGDPIEWSLGGPDKGDFTIEGGVLAFKSQPDYESPVSASVGTLADRNVYNVTVEATGGSEEVVVTVTNVDEDGSVGFKGLGRYQPQVGRGLEATLSDQDGGVTDEAWQWARSMDMGTWTDIDGATAQKRTPVAADEGYYLRASVTYTDMFGSGKMVSAVTGNAVEGRTLSNALPLFNDQDDDDATEGIQVGRSVDENTAVGVNIGSSVSASDADNDVLVYELVDTPDLKTDDNKARFTITRSSGQIKVGKKLGADGDQPEDEDSATEFPANDYPWLNDTTDGATAYTAATTNVYILMVKATDPSGASMTQAVAVTVNDINEPPAFEAGADVPTVLNVTENLTALRVGATGGDPLSPTAYDADDQDADTNEAEGEATLTRSGADAKYFTITNEGQLAFVVDDQDTTEDESHTPNFEKKSSYAITIVATSGEDDRLRRTKLDVTVHVIDAEDVGTVSLTAREPQVGRTVVATVSDPDGGVTLTRWTWATADAPTGQGQTCANAVDNDFTDVTPDVSSGAYTPKTADAGKCLRATATYTDNIEGDAIPADTTNNDNDSDTNANMDGIDVPEVSEEPVQTSDPANTAPEFPDQDLATEGDQSDEAMRSVAENMDDETVGGQISATDDDGDAMLYTLSGDDSASFKVDNSGQIRTKVKLDFETKDEYMVALTATDPSGANDSILVTISVTDGPDKAVITGVTSADYAEDRRDAVASFSATDQDGDAIVWSLDGDDKGDFTIEGGVLAFKSQPDYESPVSASVGTLADRNVYNVTVEATGGSEEVVVTVTNVDEDGSVGFKGLGRYQPQVGRGLEATLSDQDGGVTDEAWQWARSMDMQTWMDIDGATSAKRTPVAADADHYLRASVTYADMFGAGKMVSAVTGNAVEGRTLSNAPPLFNDQDDDDATEGIQVGRSVDENTAVGVNIGSPVSASDADNDALVYELVDTPDLKTDDNKARFTIARSSGQIKVGKKLGADDGTPDQREDELTDLDALDDGAVEADNPANNSEYVVRVKAIDPSGATRTVNVVITVNDVNEAPAFAAGANVPTVLNVMESNTQLRVGATGDDPLSPTAYDANDQDADRSIGDNSTPADNETDADLDLSGADKKYFEITDAGALTVVDNDPDTDEDESHEPDFEKKSSYAITIVATSGEGDRVLRARLDVTVHVIDAEDTGTVSLTVREPQVGRTVVATVSDPDGGVALTRWTWAVAAEPTGQDQTCANATDGDFTGVDPDVSSGAYTPKAADVGMCLRATATYKDNIGDDEVNSSEVSEKPVQGSDPANTAPEFPDQDLSVEGDQSDEAMRSVAENMDDETVGNPVYADDTDGDALLYTLSGDDSASFKVDNNGQIKTKVKLDFETKDMYMVALTATDPSGAGDSIMVMISVIDGPDGAVITPITGPAPEPGDTCGGGDEGSALVLDCRTLLDIMDDLVGDGTASLNWSEDTAIGDWVGVAGTGSGRVTHIHLRGRGLAGEIPAGITALDALEKLTLTDNDLTGEIPDLSGLDSIEWLVLGGNAFTGGIPASLGGLESLLQLWLHRNDGGFEGGIPAELGSLPNLRYLMLYGNDLTGAIPSELGNATNMKALYLSNNMLTGSIPASLGMMVDAEGASVRLLYLHNNMLSGDVPAELGNLTSLVALRLSGNSLSGCIPAAIFDAAVDADAAGLMACAP